MRSMTSLQPTMEKKELMVEVTKDRPATTTATGRTRTAASTNDTATSNKRGFRKFRFGLKSPTHRRDTTTARTSINNQTITPTSITSSNLSPRPRLRSLPLRLRRLVTTSNNHQEEETSAMVGPIRSKHARASSHGSVSTASCSNNSSQQLDFILRCTKIMTVQETGQSDEPSDTATPTATDEDDSNERERELSRQSATAAHEQAMIVPSQKTDLMRTMMTPDFNCATAILQHSYLEMVCGRHDEQLAMEENDPIYNCDAAENTNKELSTHSKSKPKRSSRRHSIPDDPTVQDSIECVFASQLEEGLPLWADDDDDNDDDMPEHRDDDTPNGNRHYQQEPINAPACDAELPSPATFMQSRQRTRTTWPHTASSLAAYNGIDNHNHAITSNLHHHNLRFVSDEDGNNNTTSKRSVSPTRTKTKTKTAKMVHVGTFDPRTNRLLEVGPTAHNLMEEDPQVKVCCSSEPPPPSLSLQTQQQKCFCHAHSTPLIPVEDWPQAPLLLRPTPGTGMVIRGIRFSGSNEHLWKPSDGGWWLTPLYELEGKEAPQLPASLVSSGMCSECCVLPINNGNEPIGKALVTDFETPLFEGSLLLRLRHVEGGATSTDPSLVDYDDTTGYFAGLNRRYQVVIRGKFKASLPMTGMVSGCAMDRPVGRLPAKWIMKGAIKVLSFFAPQLEVQMDGPRPRTMAPLGSTPQALVVQDIGPNDDALPPLDAVVEEPKIARDSLLRTAFPGTTSLQRARGRKKAFDKLYAAKSPDPSTKVSAGSHETYYTFEFLQHLVNFQEFSVELGNLLGSMAIAPILNGQPIPIMAMMKDSEQKLWSFDIWHESLVEGSQRHDAKKKQQSSSSRAQ